MFCQQFGLQQSSDKRGRHCSLNSLTRSLSHNGVPQTPFKSVRKKRRISSLSRSVSVSIGNTLNMHQIQFINQGLIGKGSFGLVFKIKKLSINKNYALKRSINKCIIHNNGNISCLSDIDVPCLSEIKILKKLQHNDDSSFLHPNICRFRLFFFYDDRLHQIYELYPHGTLKQLIEFQQNKLNSLQIAQILIQIVNGLCYIHEKNIIHCDIKPENIFIDKNEQNMYILKIGDFGIATDIDHYSNETKLKLSSGDPIYIAPEILNKIDNIHLNNKYLKNIDIFSLGIIIIELIYDLKLPSKGEIFQNLRNIDNSDNHINWEWFTALHHDDDDDDDDDDDMDDDIICMIKNKFVSKMLDKNPENRISSKNLALQIDEYWQDSFKQKSLRQFLKLKLPSIDPLQCGVEEFPTFCCDKDKINHVPMKQIQKPQQQDTQNCMSCDETSDDIVQKLTF